MLTSAVGCRLKILDYVESGRLGGWVRILRIHVMKPRSVVVR
jgi:hypothetical protein